ncbi:MAG: ankyrin repeat domain-containing protein [Desulfomonilaceae bacterium]
MTDSKDMTPKNENSELTEKERLLLDAVANGAVSKVDKLLSRGEVSPDCRDNEGRTPLIIAAEEGNAALVGVLIRHGADLNAVDNDGETASMKAAFDGHLSVVKLLAENGADLEIRNNEGLTALEIAQEIEASDVVTYLTAQQDASSAHTETSGDPDDDGPTTDGPGGASLPVAAAAMASSEPRSYVPELDLESVPELENSPYFKPQQEPETAREDREEEATTPPQEEESEHAAESSGAGERAEEAWSNVRRRHDAVLGNETGIGPALPESVLAGSEERIVYDALDNKQVQGINEKTKKVVDKAGLELGDYVGDTVFKGSHMAVLKPRSQENKRFRKLKKHPDLLIDPRRLTDWTGASAVRRYCLAEGIDVSPLSGSHLIELYYVKDLKLILTLAEDAITNNYTVRQLKRAVEQLREHKDDLDPGKEIIRTFDQPVPILEDPDLMKLCTDKDRVLEELSKAERKKIRALIKARKPGLDEWKNLMGTLEGILSDLEDE